MKEELCQRSIDWTSKGDQLSGDELLLLKAGLFVWVVVRARERSGDGAMGEGMCVGGYQKGREGRYDEEEREGDRRM